MLNFTPLSSQWMGVKRREGHCRAWIHLVISSGTATQHQEPEIPGKWEGSSKMKETELCPQNLTCSTVTPGPPCAAGVPKIA